MKTISFGCKPTDKIYLEQVLPALLNKKKDQTIRPAWDRKCVKIFNPFGEHKDKEELKVEKPPRFKVGDPVKFYWKQRSKHKIFCSTCGKGITEMEIKNDVYRATNRYIPPTREEPGKIVSKEIYRKTSCYE